MTRVRSQPRKAKITKKSMKKLFSFQNQPVADDALIRDDLVLPSSPLTTTTTPDDDIDDDRAHHRNGAPNLDFSTRNSRRKFYQNNFVKSDTLLGYAAAVLITSSTVFYPRTMNTKLKTRIKIDNTQKHLIFFYDNKSWKLELLLSASGRG